MTQAITNWYLALGMGVGLMIHLGILKTHGDEPNLLTTAYKAGLPRSAITVMCLAVIAWPVLLAFGFMSRDE